MRSNLPRVVLSSLPVFIVADVEPTRFFEEVDTPSFSATDKNGFELSLDSCLIGLNCDEGTPPVLLLFPLAYDDDSDDDRC